VTHTRDRDIEGGDQSDEKTAVKTGHGEGTVKSHVGLDWHNIPYRLFG
jgi:hypothetical protein